MTDGKPDDLAFHPLTPERWPDLERLFGPQGAYGGCWCMFWRISRSEFSRNQGEGNKQALRKIVAEGRVPGLLAYTGQKPVGWISVAPRDEFASLNRSPVLRRLDDKPVWSVVCLFVARDRRGQGLPQALIQAAIDYVAQQGGKMLEAYPTVPDDRELAPVSSYMGIPTMFERAGFVQCASPSKSKAIMRYVIEQQAR